MLFNLIFWAQEQSLPQPKLMLAVACLVTPWIGVATVSIATGSEVITIGALLSATVLSLAVVRFVLIERGLARLIGFSTIVTTGFVCAATVAMSQTSIVWQVAIHLVRTVYPEVKLPTAAEETWGTVVSVVAILIATLFAAWLLLRSTSKHGGTTRKSTDLNERQITMICRTLTDHLDHIDEQLRFFDFRNSVVNPQLEKLNTTSRFVPSRSIEEVVKAAQDSEFIVVKGEPGSGKSVMLRNLTRDLLAEVGAGGKIPILLNLREWVPPDDLAHAIIVRSLDRWAKSEYHARTGARQQAVSDDEFSQLYAEGGFVLLFDSFDENSLVSNSPHNGSKIKKVSLALAEYVRASGGCVGLVFSREYKAPSAGWVDHSVYGVKPFSDEDIFAYVRDNCRASDDLLKAIFRERADLYAMAKTPLLLALLVEFSNSHDAALPATEFDIFQSFVNSRISRVLERQQVGGVALEDVLRSARQCARLNLRFRRPRRRRNQAPPPPINQEALVLLRDARLLRSADVNDVVFCHKRFQEYFRVLGMLEGEEEPPSLTPGHIDDNRDVLNLYAQICPPERADRLALQAYENLDRANTRYLETSALKHYSALVLSLRFLKTAFRNRPQVIDVFRADIRNVIVVTLWNTFDILKQKHAVESLSLLPSDTATSLVRLSLQQPTAWLRRVALGQARYVADLQKWLGRCVAAFFSKEDDVSLYFERSRSNVGSMVANSALVDRVTLWADIALRTAVILLFLGALWVPDALLDVQIIVLLLVIYLFLDVAHGSSDGGAFEFLVPGGFNRGLSGFIAMNVIFLVFWNLLGGGFKGSQHLFWNRSAGISVSWFLIFASVAMWANNVLARRRDSLDELGHVNPLARSVLVVDAPDRDQLFRFFKRNSVFFGYLALYATVHLLGNMSWVLLTVGLFWLGAIGVAAFVGVIRRAFYAIQVRLDRPKVIKFDRHFSGRRLEIAAALASVRTDTARIDILNRADAKSREFLELLRDFNNIWPEGRRPTHGARVDGYFAILDERWWGLA